MQAKINNCSFQLLLMIVCKKIQQKFSSHLLHYIYLVKYAWFGWLGSFWYKSFICPALTISLKYKILRLSGFLSRSFASSCVESGFILHASIIIFRIIFGGNLFCFLDGSVTCNSFCLSLIKVLSPLITKSVALITELLSLITELSVLITELSL